MLKVPLYFIFSFLFLLSCENSVPEVSVDGSTDPDIVLVNIEDGDREFISKILLKIDSLKPIAIGIDVFFIGKKTPREDSALSNTLRIMSNDILCYGLDDNNMIEHSAPVFTKYVTDEGYLNFDYTLGLISNMTPLPKVRDNVHESFAYKILKHWKPGFKLEIKENQKIPIHYQRTQEHYLNLDGSFLIETNIDHFDLSNKIFLVGYIGPGTEDKYSTPLRFVGEEPEHEEPDTYGLVIIANQIRTLIDYKK